MSFKTIYNDYKTRCPECEQTPADEYVNEIKVYFNDKLGRWVLESKIFCPICEQEYVCALSCKITQTEYENLRLLYPNLQNFAKNVVEELPKDEKELEAQAAANLAWYRGIA